MGDENEDQEISLLEEKQQITKLQVEIARKQENRRRVIQKKENLQSELDQRQRDLEGLEADLRSARDRKVGRTGKKDEAQETAMREQVFLALQRRIPLLNENVDREGEHDNQFGITEQEEDTGTTERLHDTVLIAYVYITQPKDAKSSDEFLATYRIGPDTTVDSLLRDACEYWGCLPHEFGLYPIEDPDADNRNRRDSTPEDKAKKPEPLPGHQTVQQYLPKAKRSQLFLRAHKDVEPYSKKTKADKDKQKADDSKDRKEDETRLTSLASGAPRETTKTWFVEALRHWPGVYHPVKERTQDQMRHRAGIKFRNLCIYFFLTLLCSIAIYIRAQPAANLMVSGIQHTMGTGVPGETSNGLVQNFFEIKHYDEIWDWAGGTFHYQLFNSNSAMRGFYTPLAFLRIRQQKAASVAGGCVRPLPVTNNGGCYYAHVKSHSQQQREPLIPPVEYQYIIDAAGFPGRSEANSFLEWHENSGFCSEFYGRVQATYDGSGYSLDFSLAPENLTHSGQSFEAHIPFLREWWVDSQTRMLQFELILANYNLDDGYASVSFMVEMGPSGTVIPLAEVRPLWIRDVAWSALALWCDIFKAIIVFGYTNLVGFYFETYRTASKGRKCLGFVISFPGLLDALVTALFIGIMAMRGNYGPPEPTKLATFYSYSHDALIYHSLKLADATLLLLVVIRWTTFLKVVIGIYRFWRTFSASSRMFLFNLLIVVPFLLGMAFVGNALFSDNSSHFATLSDSLSTVILSTQASVFDPHILQLKVPNFTLLYMVVYFVAVTVFFWNTFLAITAHSYFQVSLLENSNPGELTWNFDQWCDFILWPQVYAFLFKKEPGSSKRVHAATEKAEEKEDDDDDDDDEDPN